MQIQETVDPRAVLGAFARRFTLEDVIGRGAFGVVYRALDHEEGLAVALKVPHERSARAVLSAKTEFRALCDVRHPNLCALHELFVDGDLVFFTMDLLHGQDVRRHVERVGIGALPELLGGLAAGLGALHAADVLHRDLKPSNAWVVQGGTPVLLDFGLAIRTAADGHGLDGTPAYLAPELFLGARPTPSSDVYALGALAFELATGAPLFRGTFAQIAERKRSPSAVVCDGPLGPLIARMLDPDPAARPAASEIAHLLQPARHAPRRAPPRLVGREVERERIERALRDLSPGAPTVVWVEGEAGIGKTALLSPCLDPLAASHLVLRARCAEGESLPLAALDGLVDGIARQAPAPSPALAILAGTFHVLSGRVAPSSLDAEARRGALPHALAEVLTSLAGNRPIVLALDDAQWADVDGGSLLVLAVLELVRRRHPVALVLGLRPAREPEWLGGLSRRPDVVLTEVRLSPLPASAVRELSAEAPSAWAGRIEALSGGSPFVLELLTRSAARQAALPSLETPVESLLAAGIEAELTELAPAARRMFELVCVAGHPLRADVLSRALGHAVDAGTLRTLRTARLLRAAPTGDGPAPIEPYHDRLRELVCASLGPARVRFVHRVLAETYLALGDGEVLPACMHLRAIGDARARGLSVRAAQAAWDRAAFALAAELFAFALEEAPGPERLALRVKLADALSFAGRAADAARVLEPLATDAAIDREARIELGRRAGELYLRAGYFAEGRRHLLGALQARGAPVFGTRAAALVSLLSDRRAIRRAVAAPPSRRAQDRATERRIETLTSAAIGLSVVDSIRAAAWMASAARAELEGGSGTRLATRLSWYTAFSANVGGPAERENRAMIAAARRHAEGGLASAPPELHDYALACVESAAALTEFHLGHVAVSRAHADRAIHLFEHKTRGTTKESSTMHGFRLAALALEGRLAELSRSVDEQLERCLARGDRLATVHYRQGLMVLRWLAKGRPDLAQQDLDRSRDDFDAPPFLVPHWFDLWGRVTVDLFRGDAEGARRRWSQERPRLLRSLLVRTQWTRTHSLALEAATALALGRRVPVLLAAAALDRERRPHASALAALYRAALLSQRDLGAAERALAAAAEQLDAAELHLHARCARAILGARDPAWEAAEGVTAMPALAAALVPGWALRGR